VSGRPHVPWQAVVALAGAAAAARLFAFPRTDAAVTADAVVALDGDRPRRVRAAVGLAAAGHAPVLVLVRGDAVAPELVAGDAGLPFDVVTFVPEPSSTRGEARGVATLARERGWRRILVVTSTTHVTRARLIFRRGLVCDVRVLSAGMTPWLLPRNVALEVLKLGLALTLRRSP
jgi:uncharacterized SAM-binding protein YcdF (DUF218 family)